MLNSTAWQKLNFSKNFLTESDKSSREFLYCGHLIQLSTSKHHIFLTREFEDMNLLCSLLHGGNSLYLPLANMI